MAPGGRKDLTVQYDFFYRRESNTHNPKDRPAVSITVDIPVGTPVQIALDVAIAAGMSRGTHRTGCFEIQNDEGIWAHVAGNRIDFSTPGKAAKVVYKTWDEIEAAEEVA